MVDGHSRRDRQREPAQAPGDDDGHGPGEGRTRGDPDTTETTEVGVVWQTERDGGPVTWIVLDSEVTRVRYAFVYADIAAGTVSVATEPDGEHTLARVTYDVTALKPDGVAYIDALASGFDEQMKQWASLLDEATSAGNAVG